MRFGIGQELEAASAFEIGFLATGDLEGKARGLDEWYAKASDHFYKLGALIAISLIVSYILYKLTGCS